MKQRKSGEKSSHKIPSEAKASYEKLVADIGGLIDGVRAQGIDPFPRMDLLTCQSCGAYENEFFNGPRFIAHKNGQPVREGLGILMRSDRYPADAVEKLLEGLSEEDAEKKIRYLMSPENFIVVDWKETHRTLKNHKIRYHTKYSFICSVCGADQREIFTNDFDPR